VEDNQGTKDPANLFLGWKHVAPSSVPLSVAASELRNLPLEERSKRMVRTIERSLAPDTPPDRLIVHKLGRALAEQFRIGQLGLLCTDVTTSRRLEISRDNVMIMAGQLPGEVYVPLPAVKNAFDYLSGGLTNGVGKALRILSAPDSIKHDMPPPQPEIILDRALAWVEGQAVDLPEAGKLFVVKAKSTRAPARP